MPRPLDPAHDLADLTAGLDAGTITEAAARLRLVATLPAPTGADELARSLLTLWADALDAAC